MSEDEREQFVIWCDELKSKNYIFDFKKEILHYCKSDVTILRLACLAFRQTFIEYGGIYPFTDACTIASSCNKLFRKNYLKTNTIGIIPSGGYRLAYKQSYKAIEWLVFCEKKENTKIMHAARGREIRLPIGFLVDGYRETVNEKIVYQFHGFFFQNKVFLKSIIRKYQVCKRK